ncbi:MAG: cydA [Chlamydiales bacterium]|jgi:cytochrome d ubiquinol oxidase subunit I|nr:cydA [Chlamydiales bacterium]
MDVEILARVQFALTIMFHYIYPPLSIGLGIILVIMESAFLFTKDPFYQKMCKFWTKVFALTFAIGVATGIVMEFEFGTNWATYSKYVGDVFGSALAAEGVFAFFLESGFLALLLFGWDRLGPKMHFFSTLMVCLGSHFSAVWIVVANSWMHTPQGYKIVGEGLNARAEITDFWQMVFNPSSVDRLTHVVIGAWLAGAFFVIAISAYYLLKKKHEQFALSSLKIALSLALFSCFAQAASGHSSGQVVARHQPMKLAALEALYETEKGAPLTLFGIVNTKEKRVDYAIQVPKLLSFVCFDDMNAEVQGLDRFPEKDWPKVQVIFYTYRLMLSMWGAMLSCALLTAYFIYKGTLSHQRWLLRALTFSALFPQLANQAGWVSAEMGRYPWLVHELLRISDGLSKAVTANQILGSIIMFTLIYSLLFILFLYLLHEKVSHGPEDDDPTNTYHLIKDQVGG